MTTQSASDAKNLIILAERMGLPADEAMRQVAHLITDERPEAEPTAKPTEAPPTEVPATEVPVGSPALA